MRTSAETLSLVAGGILLGAVIGSAGIDIIATGATMNFVEREEKRFTISGRPDVRLSTFDGSIEVRTWDRPEVVVEIEKVALSKEAVGDIEVRTEQNANQVTLDARLKDAPRHFGFRMNRRAKLIVSLPASADLRATSGDGSIKVERVDGRIELRSGDGSIRGRDLSGDVTADTGDGSIRLEDVAGALDAVTADGSIVASGTLSVVKARSGDGSVSVRAYAGSRATGDWTISTGDGAVTLELPQGFSAELDAHTGDGRVVVPRTLSRDLEGGKRTARGRLGEGGRLLRVRSGDGSIVLR
jgi:DUF4097 and DUF4098 domain-containing protein YvlB